jgi:hypothetical protein
LAGTAKSSISLLRNAYLPGAKLAGANLNGADLTGAHLGGANLTNANLVHADLSGAFLRGATFKGADLTGGDLSKAYLDDANLAGAEPDDANLSNAFVKNTNFKNVSGVTKEQLAAKRFLEGATMPDGSKEKADDKPTDKDPSNDDRSEADLIKAVEDYYEAVDREDWVYTYQHLDSQTQAMFTEEEWHLKNQWFADTEQFELATMDVSVNGSVPDPVVGVTVK